MVSRKDRESSGGRMGGYASWCFCDKDRALYVNRRISADLSRRGFVAGMAASMLSLVLPKIAGAQSASPPPPPAAPIVFTNFRLFDGQSAALRDGLTLTVEGDRVGRIERGQAAAAPASTDGRQVVDCGGRVMMPGLIDMHWHALLAALPIEAVLQGDFGYVYIAASAEAERTLLRGFTTIRDAGGPAFALKQAIDSDVISGPRVYPSGAMITTTGGHGDFRPLSDIPKAGGQISTIEKEGGAVIADTADEVRLRAREQLMQGASQVKIIGGGGVSTPRAPLDMVTFSEPQLRAAVETAGDWGTYVLVHAYTPESIQRSVSAGVQCIEHGHLMDDRTAALLAKSGTWLSIQPFYEGAIVPRPSPVREKQLEIIDATDGAYRLAKKHGVKTAFGSDLLFSQVLATRQGAMLAQLKRWYSAGEALTMATGGNGRLLALSDRRNPYPGKLGVLEEGAYADLLLVNGNPLENLELIADPAKSLSVVMKGGRFYKNTLAA
ncbi:metal-dependent hydrolase family protein [Paraburkholderia caballeronis]|nr:amidohydrolase family protein [Paraburkholderia caballeronis]